MKRSKGLGLRTAMLVIIVAIFAAAIVQPVMSEGNKPEQTEFKHGKTVWLLHVYTGEFWWNTIAQFLKQHVEADGWKFNFVSADGSDTTQFDQIITYAQQADILFVYPTSTNAINEAVRIAEEQYHCPVVSYTNFITGKSSGGCLMYDDETAGQLMAKEAVEWIQKKYGTTQGKTVIAINGDLTMSGWKLRQDGFDWIKKNHPEINYIEITGGLTPEGWADVADSCIAGAGSNVDAIISASDGPYLLGTLQALAKYGKLYYKGDPNHVFIASIDGKPSTLSWCRYGYVDTVFAQVPDVMAAVQWDLAKKYLLKDASYQYPPYKIPEIPLPLTIRQPKGTYWGGENLVAKLDKVSFSQTAIAISPLPRITYENVNTWEIYGNSIVKVLGEDIDPVPTFAAKGTRPPWSEKLLSEYQAWKKK
jgi:ABC-type sugar transport system substrate-binding protein